MSAPQRKTVNTKMALRCPLCRPSTAVFNRRTENRFSGEMHEIKKGRLEGVKVRRTARKTREGRLSKKKRAALKKEKNNKKKYTYAAIKGAEEEKKLTGKK